MLMKLTDFYSRILLVVFIAFSSFSLGRRGVNLEVSTSIQKTSTTVPSPSFESFRGILNKSVSQIYTLASAFILSVDASFALKTAIKSSKQWQIIQRENDTMIYCNASANKLKVKREVAKPKERHVSL